MISGEALQYVRRVVEMVVFFRDMLEENNDGRTDAIRLLKPRDDVGNLQVRQFVLYDLYRMQKCSVTEAALALAAWQPEGKCPAPFPLEDIRDEIVNRCSAEERPLVFIWDQAICVERSFARAARYLRRVAAGEAPAHSRVVEVFIPNDFVPRGRGKRGGGHAEHVVPCALLRDISIRRYNAGATEAEVADFLQQNVVIVDILPEQQQRLDGKKANGGLDLKTTMPEGWEFGRDCIFARLHEANIPFDPPPNWVPCSH